MKRVHVNASLSEERFMALWLHCFQQKTSIAKLVQTYLTELADSLPKVEVPAGLPSGVSSVKEGE